MVKIAKKKTKHFPNSLRYVQPHLFPLEVRHRIDKVSFPNRCHSGSVSSSGTGTAAAAVLKVSPLEHVTVTV